MSVLNRSDISSGPGNSREEERQPGTGLQGHGLFNNRRIFQSSRRLRFLHMLHGGGDLNQVTGLFSLSEGQMWFYGVAIINGLIIWSGDSLTPAGLCCNAAACAVPSRGVWIEIWGILWETSHLHPKLNCWLQSGAFVRWQSYQIKL